MKGHVSIGKRALAAKNPQTKGLADTQVVPRHSADPTNKNLLSRGTAGLGKILFFLWQEIRRTLRLSLKATRKERDPFLIPSIGDWHVFIIGLEGKEPIGRASCDPLIGPWEQA